MRIDLNCGILYAKGSDAHMGENVTQFRDYLINEEKSNETITKYLRDVSAFLRWIGNREITKSAVLSYKTEILGKYAPKSVNSMLASLNVFLKFIKKFDCTVKSIKLQRQMFSDKELTKAEYERLLIAAEKKKNKRLYYLMQTICSTGIRVSEHKYITAEAVEKGSVRINLKGKMRVVILPKTLCKMLKKYIKEENIKSGSVFITKNGKPLDRSNIWNDMKKLCESAGVDKEKVFPHNLRHLFARTYYSLQKDISRLADILGHTSINTTRIYTIESGEVHRRQIERMNLLRFRE